MGKRIDINHKYRLCAVFCLVHGSKDNGRALITWDQLRSYLGESWETYVHELTVKGMLHSSAGYVYLSKEWLALSRAEGMSRINQMYPREYVQY